MKQYIKPTTSVEKIMLAKMIANSISEISGVDGVTKSDSEYGGGASDTKSRDVWSEGFW